MGQRGEGGQSTVHPRGRGEQLYVRSQLLVVRGSSPRTRGTGKTRHTLVFLRAVHPRGRGEQPRSTGLSMTIDGSSPRTRGTGCAISQAHLDMRFIPADAGNRQSATAAARRSTVHPRGRGEQSTSIKQPLIMLGSSPRTRGTVAKDNPNACGIRFIPADAGNRSLGRCSARHMTVHPRGRGEQGKNLVNKEGSSGSSPRTRGTAVEAAAGFIPERFIPADAGNRSCLSPARCRGSVHPRGRGEQNLPALASIGNTGSSPRTRGTGHYSTLQAMRGRFIPADAGNRFAPTARHSNGPVHPRGRGEQGTTPLLMHSDRGSSPRTRGTVAVFSLEPVILRFIPADAGNRSSCQAARTCAAVHPRGRGEQHGRQWPGSWPPGSSPRTRGTGPDRGTRHAQIGFIPADAGNSWPLDIPGAS